VGNPPDPRPGWRPHERELLELVSLGQTNKEIAGRLGVSESAIKKRLGRLMRLLGADSRVGPTRAALARGLISVADEGRDDSDEDKAPVEP
jgi:DNA-binding NarL/FixJ family response regulator